MLDKETRYEIVTILWFYIVGLILIFRETIDWTYMGYLLICAGTLWAIILIIYIIKSRPKKVI